MIKISHEVPLDLLDNSLTFNDYDYCLPTYFLKYEKYREYFLKAREKGRFIIMDNGLFEGDTFTDNQLFLMIEEIQPNIFIVPDMWNDPVATKNSAAKWKENYYKKIPSNTELMVVLQGATFYDIEDLYDSCYYRYGYTHFGFNHSSTAYDALYPHSNSVVSKMMGRITTFNTMIKNNTLVKSNYHHFLGCSLPQEMYLLDTFSKSYINSIDTSNPVIWGALGIQYKDTGFLVKPEIKIDKFMEVSLYDQYSNIIFNINKFKQFVHG
jgi:hypothetical protein